MRPLDRRRLLARLGVAAAAASLPAAEAFAATAAEGNFASHPRWKFHFLSFMTTSPVFVPLQYGIQDACALVGCTFAWGGTAKGDSRELAKAVDAAVTAKADGIAVTLADPAALAAPFGRARKAGIPLVAFHADAPHARRLAYIGHDRRAAGAQIGSRIAKAVGKGEVLLFVGTIDAPVAKPTLDGVLAALGSSAVHPTVVDTGRDVYAQMAAIEKQLLVNEELRGMFAFDVGSTQGITSALKKHRPDGERIKAGGYGVLPATLELIDDGRLDFAVDEQPYLQGFATVVQLFLAKLSGGLAGPSDVRTGPILITRENVKPYLTTRTRYEGSSSKQKYPIA